MRQITINTKRKCEMIDISQQVRDFIKESDYEEGMLFLNTLHTTAGLTINENGDPDVQDDILRAFEEIIPKIRFKHFEGNSDAHIKSTLFGTSLTIPVTKGQLIMGTWQGIYFCEFDGGRNNRKIHLKFLKGE